MVSKGDRVGLAAGVKACTANEELSNGERALRRLKFVVEEGIVADSLAIYSIAWYGHHRRDEWGGETGGKDFENLRDGKKM